MAESAFQYVHFNVIGTPDPPETEASGFQYVHFNVIGTPDPPETEASGFQYVHFWINQYFAPTFFHVFEDGQWIAKPLHQWQEYQEVPMTLKIRDGAAWRSIRG